MIEVRELERTQLEAYRRFIREDQRTLIYTTPEFREFLSAILPGKPIYLLAVKDGRIVGSLPYFRLEAPGMGVVINSLPWYGSHGACTILPEADDVRNALLNKYREAVWSADVLSATMILTPFEELRREHYEKILKPTAIDSRIGQMTHLPSDGMDLDQRLEEIVSQKTRNLIRKSLKQGFSAVTSDEDWAWKFLSDTHTENMEGVGGRAKPWNHFIALRERIPQEARRLWIALLGKQAVAAVLLLYFNRTVEYITPVIKHEFRSQQPLSFLIYQAMLNAVKAGYRWWNWGGTWASQQSLHHFKAGWGARDFPYSYLITSSQQGLGILNANKDRLQMLFPYYYTYPYSLLK